MTPNQTQIIPNRISSQSQMKCNLQKTEAAALEEADTLSCKYCPTGGSKLSLLAAH